MRRLAVLYLVFVSGCRFDPGGNAVRDADPLAPDADPSAPDADPTAPDADRNAPDADPMCGFSFDPTFFDACADPLPASGELVIANGEFLYNTDIGSFSPPVGGGNFAVSNLNGVHVIWTRAFDLRDSASLRVTGALPLMIVARDDVQVLGSIDASSGFDGTAFNLGAGASLDPAVCTAAPGPGIGCGNHGASGGGGGGFGTAGGESDHGAAQRDGSGCVDGEGPEPGGGAVAMPVGIRGGCAGAPGSFTEDGGAGDEGVGGPGGGAIHLVAGRKLTVNALIHAGGSGGAGATGGRASGGGGGSGGYIGLEAMDIALEQSGILAANGGGGGGGVDNGTGGQGENGKPDESVAAGGSGNGGGTGNGGGFLTTAPEAPSLTGDRGGGGGGGAVGYVLFYVHGVVSQTAGIVSPPELSTPPQ